MPTNKEPGLSTAEAERLLKQHRPNVLPSPPPVSVWRLFIDQFRSALIYILLFALAVDLTVWFIEGHSGWPFESVAIAAILLLNAGLGVYQESKAEKALAHLKALAESSVWVMRDGGLVRLPSADLVPQDIVRVEAGDRVPADGVLIEAHGIAVDESVVTGESLPIEKAADDLVLSGTLFVRGKGYFEVVRTGAASTAGSLAAMIGAIEVEQTPLERRLTVFGGRVARWILLLVLVIAVGGILIEGLARLGHIFLFAVALAVAVVPEGLPAVLTLTLALGVERMARKKAVVRRLSAVEALGSVTVIATDKTGTITENRMHVKDVDTRDHERALRAMTLANDAEYEIGAGDPLELALLQYAVQHIDVDEFAAEHPRRSVVPFDSADKFMRVTVEESGSQVSYLKGASEVLLERSQLNGEERKSWEKKAEGYAAQGFRVLALAWCYGEVDDDLNFLGLVLLWDPPRKEVPEAIRQARDAGIRVIMVTGDHPATALAVANAVGIPPGRVVTGVDLEAASSDELNCWVSEANVFARMTPLNKLRLIETLKARGEIVAVTGDGVNDAPALKRSDVGVAMGQRGSDVSREVADLVLLDDNFATIVAAIKEGRNIYENIQKFIRFLFSANFALTLIVLIAAIGSLILSLREHTGGLLLPLTAMQLLWINVITNGPPALALSLDRNYGLMRWPPRDPQTPLLDQTTLRFLFIVGAISALIGGLLLITLRYHGYGFETSRTLLFLYATISQLILVYPARRLITMPRVNVLLHLTVAVCLILQLLTVTVPWLRLVLGLTPVDARGLMWVAGAIAASWAVAEIYSRAATWSVMEKFGIRFINNLPLVKRVVVAVVGGTVVLIGVALLVLPGPGLVVISLGLALLATEFVWARALLKKAQAAVATTARTVRGGGVRKTSN